MLKIDFFFLIDIEIFDDNDSIYFVVRELQWIILTVAAKTKIPLNPQAMLATKKKKERQRLQGGHSV